MMGSLKFMKPWLLAVRPKTLWASIAPVLMGTAMAIADQKVHWPSAAAALLGAVLIQIGTNLANDYYDAKSGVDSPMRNGPLRVTQSGMIAPKKVKLGFVLCFLMVMVIALFLFSRAGWPVLLIGILSILSGYFYTAGPKPLSHLGLGDFFVLVFFGPVAVAGTYFVQGLSWPLPVILAGFAPGLFSVAILAVNNIRDFCSDRAAGKRTLVVRFGLTFGRMEYALVLFATVLIPFILFSLFHYSSFILLSSIVTILLLPTAVTIFNSNNPDKLNQALALTGKVLFLYALIFAMGVNYASH